MKRLSQAEEYLIRFGVTDPQHIDLEALAWTMGAKVKYKSLSSCEAKITGIGDKAIITIDDGYGERRARFSLSHEIGHWQRHRNQILACTKQDIGGINGKAAHKEREADRYAADFMMPAYLFRSLMRDFKKPTFQSIDELSNAFRSSRKATALRFIDMDTAESMLICHGPNGRKWYRGSRDWPDEWAPKRDHEPDSGVMDLLFGKSAPVNTRTLVPASAFFGRYSADQFNVYAHSVISRSKPGQTDVEVMTFITPESSDMFDDVAASRGW